MAASTTGLRLSEKTKARLDALGKARARSPHYLMNEAIERFLDQEEAVDAEWKIVKSRWERFELTGEALDHSEIEAWAAELSKPKAR
jgi:predicted transcriptional regulator